MKITIENISGLDIADATRIVADLLRREREFMLANTVGGCHFNACGVTVGHLYQIETGRVRASAGLLARIGSLLAMDVNRLLAANGQIAPALEEALLRRPAAWGKIVKELE